MKRLESNLLNMVLSLTLISLVAAGALGGIYSVTKEPIEKTNEANKLKAKTDVLPTYSNLTFAEPEEVEQDGYTMVINRAFDAQGNPVGAAVETSDKNGFNGLIRLMVGFDREGNIQGYSVLEQAETPGLGANMVEWFKTDKNRQSIVGLNPANSRLEVSKDGGDVDAITAATISSRAFLRAVERAYNAYQSNGAGADALSGATAVVDSLSLDSLNTDSVALDSVVPEVKPIAPSKPKVVQIKDTVITPAVQSSKPAKAAEEKQTTPAKVAEPKQADSNAVEVKTVAPQAVEEHKTKSAAAAASTKKDTGELFEEEYYDEAELQKHLEQNKTND